MKTFRTAAKCSLSPHPGPLPRGEGETKAVRGRGAGSPPEDGRRPRLPLPPGEGWGEGEREGRQRPVMAMRDSLYGVFNKTVAAGGGAQAADRGVLECGGRAQRRHRFRRPDPRGISANHPPAGAKAAPRSASAAVQDGPVAGGRSRTSAATGLIDPLYSRPRLRRYSAFNKTVAARGRVRSADRDVLECGGRAQRRHRFRRPDPAWNLRQPSSGRGQSGGALRFRRSPGRPRGRRPIQNLGGHGFH